MTYLDGATIRELLLRQSSSDTSVVGQIIIDNAFDINKLKRCAEIKAFLSNARKSGKRPLIVDAGANIGLASIYFSAQCRDAIIVAIEPEPSNFAMLLNNVQGLPVLPIPCALAASPGKVRILDTGEGFWAFQTRAVSPGEESEDFVDCITIDEILDQHRDQFFPFIIKIDIEGAEKDLFEKNIDWIQQTPVIIVEPHDWMLPAQGVSLPFLRAIAPLDRDFVIVGENIFSIANNLEALLPHPRGTSAPKVLRAGK